MKRRLLAGVLTFAMMLSLLPTVALAQNDEDPTASTDITMQYDDYYAVEDGARVDLTDAGAVLEFDGSTIHAIGLGTATVSINGEKYTVSVEKAKVNIILVGGQSNATGEYNGNYLVNNQNEFDVAPVECDKGTAYLWGRSATEPAQLTGMLGKGWRSSLAKELYAETHVKTAIVYDNPLTARPGANINEWQDDNTTTNPDVGTSAAMVKACYDYFNNSQYYDVESCGLYWLQGEANASNDPDTYYIAFMNMYNALKATSPVEYCAFLRVRRTTQTGIDYMGPVIAQFQMANDHADMFMATTLTENWVDSDYNTQITVDTSKYQSIDGDSATQEYYKLFGGIHYYQRGYNFIGADAAYQMTKATSSDPENAIIMGDTTGKNNVTLALGSTVEKTKDETTTATKNFMFYAAPGSEASTVSVKVESDGVDITNRVIASTGSSAYLVNMAAIKLCKDPVVTATMKNSAGADLGSVQVRFTTGVAVTPEPDDDAATEGIYYHWDFTDKSTYLAGVEENGDTSTTAPMQIKTAADSGAKGYLIYQGSTNEALSYSSTNGLVRSDAIRDTDSVEYDKAFVINNNQMNQGITVTPENGFLIEFTASTPNSNGIVLGKGSAFVNGGHPLLYFSSNNMTLHSNSWKFNASNAAANRSNLSTYQFLYDGEKLHLKVTDTQSEETVFDKDVTVDGNIADWTINYLFPTFSTNPTNKDKSYLFAGNITDLKIATDAYKTLTITNQDGIDDSFEIVGVTNGQKIPTFENTTFRINTKNNSELANVSAENATLTYDPDTLTYTLNNITGDVTLNIQTQVNYHNWVEVNRTEPTCTAPGSVSYKCSDEGCLATKQETLPALGHKWEEGTVVTAPSGITDGILRYTCSRCQATKDEKIPAASNYYHWDFTDKRAYVSGLNDDGTASTKDQMKIKSASDSPERYWVYSEKYGTEWTSNDTLAYSADNGLTRTGNSDNSFKLQDANGKASIIDMTSKNGFKLQVEMNMTDGGNSFVLGVGGRNTPPWFYRDDQKQLKLGNYINYIHCNVANTANKMTTYTYAYDGTDTYHIHIAQGNDVIYDDDVEMVGRPYENYAWNVLMPCFADTASAAFKGSIKDLKIWTSTNYDVTATAAHASTDIASDATIDADATLKFTVTPDAGYHVTNVTTNSGVVTKNDDGTYTLSYVTDDAQITVIAERHTLSAVAAKATTCTEAGNNAYWTCDTCDKVFKDAAGTQETTVAEETLAASGHQYGTPKYTWSDDGKSCTAEKVCSVCDDKVTETAAITSSVKTAATCTVMGTTTYTADFTDANGFTTQTKDVQDIPMIKHDWSNKDGICAVCHTKCDQVHKPGTTCEVCHKYTSYPYVPGAPTYPATAPAAPNGTVTVTPSNASKGTNVTVTVKPNEGYELGSLAVKDASGNLLPLADLGNGKFSFVMPDGKVSVEAEFVKTAATSFADVPANAYFADAVKWAVDKGITNGLTDTMFGPYESCTRAQIVTFLWRAAGSPEPTSTSTFADVPASAYYAKAVAWAVENGITNGMTETTFAPDATCTRGQSVTFLYRALKGTANGSANFADVASDAFYADAVNWAVANNVTNGTSNTTFSPSTDCTRAEIVTFLYRAYQGK